MKHFSREDLKVLMEPREGPAVSLYAPMVRAGKEVRQNAIRFKNVLRQAEDRLVEQGHRREDAQALLRPAAELHADPAFWEDQRSGFAAFVAPGFARWYRLPNEVPEAAFAGRDGFHLKPMLRLVAEDGRFYLLTLSQNRVRFYEAFPGGLEAVDLAGLPESLREVLLQEGVEPVRQLQFRGSGPPAPGPEKVRGSRSPGAPSGAVHAHDPAQDEKERIAEFFRKVDEALWEVLRHERAPLLLAGVEYLHPLYREANRYSHLMDFGLPGNVDEINPADLHAMAWSLMERHFQRRRLDASARYRELAGTGLASDNLELVVPAACQGRVDTLFVPVDRQEWGRYDPEEGRVERSEGNGAVDLLNLAAVQTLLAGGRVLAVDPGQVPGEGPVAAVFRY